MSPSNRLRPQDIPYTTTLAIMHTKSSHAQDAGAGDSLVPDFCGAVEEGGLKEAYAWNPGEMVFEPGKKPPLRQSQHRERGGGLLQRLVANAGVQFGHLFGLVADELLHHSGGNACLLQERDGRMPQAVK